MYIHTHLGPSVCVCVCVCVKYYIIYNIYILHIYTHLGCPGVSSYPLRMHTHTHTHTNIHTPGLSWFLFLSHED
jgi:hypothetical protein